MANTIVRQAYGNGFLRFCLCFAPLVCKSCREPSANTPPSILSNLRATWPKTPAAPR